jgi:hypothetical protein
MFLTSRSTMGAHQNPAHGLDGANRPIENGKYQFLFRFARPADQSSVSRIKVLLLGALKGEGPKAPRRRSRMARPRGFQSIAWQKTGMCALL